MHFAGALVVLLHLMVPCAGFLRLFFHLQLPVYFFPSSCEPRHPSLSFLAEHEGLDGLLACCAQSAW